jgi:hypothetical protein
MLCKATVLCTIFTIVDDTMKASPEIQRALKRPGTKPRLNERSRCNRRKRDLWAVILAVRLCLQLVLDALEFEETGAADSAPVPCVGRKRSPTVTSRGSCVQQQGHEVFWV